MPSRKKKNPATLSAKDFEGAWLNVLTEKTADYLYACLTGQNQDGSEYPTSAKERMWAAEVVLKLVDLRSRQPAPDAGEGGPAPLPDFRHLSDEDLQELIRRVI